MAAGPDQSDETLIARMNAGGPDGERAFGELYDRHKGWAMSVARRMAGDASAGDVVQDVFISFLGQFPGFELSSALRTYLYAVIRNRARDQRRKDSRLRLVGDVSEVGVESRSSASRVAPSVERQETERAGGLRDAVAELPESQREILILRIVDGFSVREVATALEIPEGTVKSRLHLAIKALRDDPRARAYFE